MNTQSGLHSPLIRFADVLMISLAMFATSSAFSAGATATPAAASRTAAASAPGKAVYERWCAECHREGPGYSGTQQLARSRGPGMAVLEKRSDLAPAYIELIVRNGLNAMPAYRPSEINEADLKALSAYLGVKPRMVKRR